MNRLWVRLTLAFVLITLVSVGTVALLADWQAGNEFQQYVGQQQMLAQRGLADDLAAYYQRVGSWQDVQAFLANYAGPGMGGGGRGPGNGRPALLLADGAGTIVYDARTGRAGSVLNAGEQGQALVISVAGQTVGYLLVSPAGRGAAAGLAAAEQAFLSQLRNTFVIAMVIALGLGLVLSIWISWTLSAPLAQVGQAARAFAGRHWESRVPVRGADEVADVARAINQMAGALQGAEAQRRQLLADIAHELRTPLAVLQGNLRALIDGVYPLDVAEIATVYDQSRLVSRLVDDLGQLALAEAGHLPMNLADIQLSPVLQAVVDDWTAVAQEQSITLQPPVTANLPPVRADATRLTQVLNNLLANALRHTPPGGSVTISAVKWDQGVRLTVSDTGEGIAPEDLPRVFDRFYRGDKARSRGSGGSGLGLAITKALVEAMGGTIAAESQVGVGSTFAVTLSSPAPATP
jgi:two-component system OmpR family sensor kinase